MSDTQYKTKTHSVLSPSAATRWLNCTASAKLAAEQDGTTETEAAELGTKLHEVAELVGKVAFHMATEEEKVKFLSGDIKQLFEEHQAIFLNYRAFILQAYNELTDPTALFEETLFISELLQTKGTADLVLIDDEVLHVIDFKSGRLKVETRNNEQLLLYAYGVLATAKELDCLGIAEPITRALKVNRIKLSIAQPLIYNMETVTISRDLLEDLAKHRLKVIEDIAKGETEFQPTAENCKYCPAKKECAAYMGEMLTTLQRLEELRNKELSALTAEELQEVYKLANVLSDFCKSVTSFVYGKLMNGEKVDGFKLVEGVGRRTIVNPDSLIDKLCKAGYEKTAITTTKIQTITALEKMVGAKNLAELAGDDIKKQAGNATIALAEDKRPEYNAAESMFGDI